jgi:hypothetical protein
MLTVGIKSSGSGSLLNRAHPSPIALHLISVWLDSLAENACHGGRPGHH